MLTYQQKNTRGLHPWERRVCIIFCAVVLRCDRCYEK